MKKFLPFLTFALSFAFVKAQLSVDADSIGLIESPAPSYEVVVHNSVTNMSNAPVTIKWLRITDNTPSSWGGSSVCDKITCWGTEVFEKTVDLGIDSSTILDVHFFNTGRTGVGYVEILVFDIADSANTVQLVKYYGEATNEQVGISTLDVKSLSIYPNPATNFIHINGIQNPNDVHSLEVYNIIGSKVAQKQINSISDLKMDIQNLENGIYLVKLYDNSQKVFYTRTFVKK